MALLCCDTNLFEIEIVKYCLLMTDKNGKEAKE